MITLLDMLVIPKNIIYIGSTALNTERVPGRQKNNNKKRHFFLRQALNKDQFKITLTDT